MGEKNGGTEDRSLARSPRKVRRGEGPITRVFKSPARSEYQVNLLFSFSLSRFTCLINYSSFSKIRSELASLQGAQNESQITVQELRKKLAEQTSEYAKKTESFELKSKEASKVIPPFHRLQQLSVITQTIAELKEKIKRAAGLEATNKSLESVSGKVLSSQTSHSSSSNSAAAVTARQRSRTGSGSQNDNSSSKTNHIQSSKDSVITTGSITSGSRRNRGK